MTVFGNDRIIGKSGIKHNNFITHHCQTWSVLVNTVYKSNECSIIYILTS